MSEQIDACHAVAVLLRRDPAFATSPHRLRQGLLDLLPDADRAVRLLTVAAETGAPGLITTGDPDAARQLLVDRAGLQPEAAAWTVAVWSAALGGADPAAPGPAVGTPTTVRLAAWPDGVLLVAVLGITGIFVAVVDVTVAVDRPVWQRVATPVAPLSRDVAVTVTDTYAVVAWSDTDGVLGCELHRRGGDLTVAAPRVLVAARDGDQPRYPIGLLLYEGSLDVFWTTDRRFLHRSTVRAWAADAADLRLPPCGATNERITRLDTVSPGPDVAWLAALTDQSRVLVARWDLSRDDIAGWVEVPAAAPTDDIALLAHQGRAVLLGCGTQGALWQCDPATVAGQQRGNVALAGGHLPAQAMAAATGAGRAWLGVRTGSTGRLIPVGHEAGSRILWG